ncbi:ParA family protein [Enterobacter cloacae complex sp. P29RS]|uniref:ParA family protein n=1 Tax=Serratia rhizosphaerae TaxID=2597702 RepID=A0ABX6GNU2_9GAMM|nr:MULTISPECIES: ParA family protein [Enterobacterales]MBE3175456.1 ParA family protein [Enterobacter cloacae complex sp. P29RS]QHA87947.1 ParA family protein [Serratia rhizosphaerae]QPT13475.1 ParA family protein [Serratia rubidaea]
MENVVTKTQHKARVVPVISTKGGEGKSTQSANLAGFLADAGKKVLLIDGDHSQPTASSIFSLEYEAPNGLYELLMKTVDLARPDQIISRSVINNLDIIVSNDPHDRLSSAMLHAPDGRMRLRNVLQHPLFQDYDVIIIDSKGAASIMLELILLASSSFAVGVIKPILPDTREFLRGTLGLMEGLLPLAVYGIAMPQVRILTNCMEYTNLDWKTLESLQGIIENGQYLRADAFDVSLLNTIIPKLEIYKLGHASGQPVHRLETTTTRTSTPAAADTMYDLACELFPDWTADFDLLRKEANQ